MGIYIELTAEEEVRLRERAEQRGKRPEALASELLRSLLSPSIPRQFAPVVDETGEFHEERWNAVLQSIAANTAGSPVLPTEALSREALYSDHD